MWRVASWYFATPWLNQSVMSVGTCCFITLTELIQGKIAHPECMAIVHGQELVHKSKHKEIFQILTSICSEYAGFSVMDRVFSNGLKVDDGDEIQW